MTTMPVPSVPTVPDTHDADTPVCEESIALDRMLLHRLKHRDEAAFEDVVRLHGGRMLAVALRLLRHDDDANDAVQEAFISAFKCIDRFEGQSQLGTWLHRIVVNAALMKLRSRRRKPECSIDEFLPRFAEDGHRLDPRPAWTTTHEDVLEQAELRQLVRRKIDELPEDYRTVLMLRDIEGLDTDATAEALGISPGAVKTRLHRARMALRERLEPEMP